MFLNVQQLPDGALLGVLRAGGIAWRRTYPLIVFADQLFVAEVFVRRIAPVNFTHAFVQVLRKGLCQSIGNRLHHDLVVVVMLGVIGFGQRILLQPAGDGKRADVVLFAAQLRRNEIGQAVVSKAYLFGLLAQMACHRQYLST